MIVLGSTAVYAVNNDHITPGNTFYPQKKTVENVEQQFSLTKGAKIDTLNKQSERRLKEALNLAQDNLENNKTETNTVASDNIQQTIDEAVNNFDEAIQTSQKIENKDKNKKTKDSIKKKNQGMIEYLDSINNIAKQNQDEELINKVNEAKNTIDKYNKELDQEEDDDSIENHSDNKEDSIIEKQSEQNTDKQKDKSDDDSDDKDLNVDSENNTDSHSQNNNRNRVSVKLEY